MVFPSTTGSGRGARRHRLAAPRIRGPIALACAAVMVLGAGSAVSLVVLSGEADAAAKVTTLAPTALTTTAGATGGQPVKALQVKDLTGSTDTWDRYVEFGGGSTAKPYSGYLKYQLPTTVTADAITALEVNANYRGPAAADQVWTWSLYNWKTSAWSTVGTNTGVQGWSAWTSLSFSPTDNASTYASSTGEIRVSLTASNSADNADVDYLGVVVTSTSTLTPTTSPTPTTPRTTAPAATTTPAPSTTTKAPSTARPTTTTARPTTAAPTSTSTSGPSGSAYTLPPANAVWDYQIGGPYTPASAVGIVDRDHTESPAAGKYNVCYVNAYQTQPGASGSWPSAALLRTANGKLVEDAEWEGEYMVDTRTATSRTAIMSVVGPWMDSCASKGFKGVEVDNLDSYTRDPSKQLTKDGSLALAKLIVDRAHSKGLAIGQKNTVELAGTGKSQIGFDFAVVESCQRWDECDGYTNVYGDQVYEVEYVEEGGQANWKKACDARGARISITYRDVLVKPAGSSGYTFKYC